MGVPKFYRWLSERYPQINQMITDNSLLPEIDNLYLDMNGIIHACSHPNDQDISKQLTLREMMLSIFRYIDRMVTEIAKPKKVLFMAIDGCAPRAKLNQQRARRFRSAQEREESVLKARQNGIEVDESAMFDSNCITPGTEFMDSLHSHLRYFIRKKMKEDPLWQNLTVIYSGHDVPGEGEHKIMQYIREARSRPDYEPNQRHCMYGQDADLIMLGLSTHEPHFTLLREVVDFSGGRKTGREVRSTVMRQTREAQFQLLHLSVLREYIEVDLAYGIGRALEKTETEQLMNDFVFLTFLVGNDFLPHLPTLDIGEHAFDTIFNAYKALLASQPPGSFIVKDGGIGNLALLEALFRAIGTQEKDILTQRALDAKQFNARRRKFNDASIPSEEELEDAEESSRQAFEEAVQEALLTESLAELTMSSSSTSPLGSSSVQVERSVSTHTSPSEVDYRGRYYFEKFQVICASSSSVPFFNSLRKAYLEGLIWCLGYYIKGCISWTWYYPFHYGPMLQDMVNLEEIQPLISFEQGRPFLPFQQLLGCLPPASRSLLPTPYQFLMTDARSPLISFYPTDFSVDMDGKRNPWEAVVLLSFFDAAVLKQAEAVHCPPELLTAEEQRRNKFGKVLIYRFDPSFQDTYPSCNPAIGLLDIPKCSSSCIAEDFNLSPCQPFIPELIPGTITPFAGFPTLGVGHIESVRTECVAVNMFGSKSKYRTITMKLGSQYFGEEGELFTEEMAHELLGRSVFVNYPSTHEARVVGVSTCRGEFRLESVDKNSSRVVFTRFNSVQENRWRIQSSTIQKNYLSGCGLFGTGGLDIGPVKVRLMVRVLQGMFREPTTGIRSKIFGKSEADVPIQLAFWEPTALDPRFDEGGSQSLSSLYPVGSEVIGTTGEYTGCKGRVMSHSESKKKKLQLLTIEFSICPPEPPFGSSIAAALKDEYFQPQEVSRTTRIPSNVLGMVVGSIVIEPGAINLGLNLKKKGTFQLLGYSKILSVSSSPRREAWRGEDSVQIVGSYEVEVEDEEKAADRNNDEGETWGYSAKTVALLMDYHSRFPLLFKRLASLSYQSKYSIAQLFGPGPSGLAGLKQVSDWLSSLPIHSMPRTPLTTSILPLEAISSIEKASELVSLRAQKHSTQQTAQLPPSAVFSSRLHQSLDQPPCPPPRAPVLGDRVMSLTALGVPCGLRGTVIALHSATQYVEVLFDEEFMGGRSLSGLCSAFRGRLCAWTSLLLLTSPSPSSSSAPTPSTSDRIFRTLSLVPPSTSSSSSPSSSTSSPSPPSPVALEPSSPPPPSTVSFRAPAELGGFRIIKRQSSFPPSPSPPSPSPPPNEK